MEHDLETMPPKKAFATAVNALYGEAMDRGWMTEYRKIMTEIGNPLPSLIRGSITADVRWRVRAEYTGEMGARMQELFGNTTFINVTRTIRLPLESEGTECVCPATEAAAIEKMKAFVNDLCETERRNGDIQWVDIPGEVTCACNAEDCSN